jgi:hypothetical protein
MTHIQQSSNGTMPDMTHFLDEVDRAANVAKGHDPVRRYTLPAYGESHRNAVTACVDGLITDIGSKIETLRKVLDTIEQRALESAARSKGILVDHIETCSQLNQEIERISDVVARLATTEQQG